ncbi:hypothetical protein ACFYX0_47705, partial [Streptomyces sp. NPDC002573]
GESGRVTRLQPADLHLHLGRDSRTPELRGTQGEAMDLDLASNNINNVRIKLKHLARRGILTEPEPGLFTLPRPQLSAVAPGATRYSPQFRA